MKSARDVSEEIWKEFAAREPGEISGRTGALYRGGGVSGAVSGPDPAAVAGPAAGAGGRGARGGAGIPALPHGVDVSLAGGPGGSGAGDQSAGITRRAPLFSGDTTACPAARWKSVSAGTRPVFWRRGKSCSGETRPAGDAAVGLEVFPGLVVEVILWQADDEFPAQVSFTLPAHLDRFWFLDAVWGLLNLVTQELLLAAAGESS